MLTNFCVVFSDSVRTLTPCKAVVFRLSSLRFLRLLSADPRRINGSSLRLRPLREDETAQPITGERPLITRKRAGLDAPTLSMRAGLFWVQQQWECGNVGAGQKGEHCSHTLTDDLFDDFLS